MPHFDRVSGPSGGAGTARSRILIVSNLFPPEVVGGAEIVAARQARALKASGAEIVVLAGGFAHDGAEPGSLSVEDREDFPVYRLILTSLDPDANFYNADNEARLLSVMSVHQPDIVHFHNVTGLGYNLIPAAKAFGARVIVTLHDHAGLCFKNTLLRDDGSRCTNLEECAVCRPAIPAPDGTPLPIRLRRDYVAWCLGQADQLLSPSRALAETFETSGVVTVPVTALSNGIDGERVKVGEKPDPTPLAFACFSYLGEHKGIPTLLAAAEILAKDPALAGRWHLTIAGHGHLAEGLTRDIAAGRFGGAVTYAGRLDHDAALAQLARTHVVVLASHWPENEPVTLLEAIASGTAQIATRIGGNPELVEHERSGLLVTPADVGSLAEAMRRVILDPELARSWGAYNAARRDRFAEERTVERLLAVYGPEAGSQTVAGSGDDEIVVLCAGRPGAHANELQLLVHRFHVMEGGGRRFRFIWHAFAGAQLWRAARALWIWDEMAPPDLPLLGRALRAGLPVVAPQGGPLAKVLVATQGCETYANLLDALGLLAALQDLPAEHEGGRTGGSARFLNVIAPPESFHLPARNPT
jgi:glycosyltransferase involved in cell wall biosynthesis